MARVAVVTSTNRWRSFVLMTGMLKLRSTGLKLMMLLKDSKESWREATFMKVVSVLKSCTPSLFAGRLSDYVKILSLISVVIELLMKLYVALEFWMALLLSRAA